MFTFDPPRTYTCLRCSRRIISPLDDLCIDVDCSTLCLWCYNHHVAHHEETLSSHLLSQILSLLYRLEKEGKWLGGEAPNTTKGAKPPRSPSVDKPSVDKPFPGASPNMKKGPPPTEES